MTMLSMAGVCRQRIFVIENIYLDKFSGDKLYRPPLWYVGNNSWGLTFL